MNLSCSMIWVTLLYKSYLMYGGLLWMRVEASYCLEWFYTLPFVAILFALYHRADQQLWHHMNHVWSSFSPSIRTWDPLNEDTFTGKSAHCNVKWINWVTNFWTDKDNCWWNSFGHTEETWQSSNHSRKFAEKIHIEQLDFSYIHTIARHNGPNWKQTTL